MDSIKSIEDLKSHLGAKLDASTRLFDAAGRKIIDYLLVDKYANRFWPFSKELLAEIDKDVDDLILGRPLEYITGIRHFFGYVFKVNEHVLIPRWETEELVDYAIKNVPINSKVLDVGTGSGCIAISFQLNRPDCSVAAMDISAGALELAKKNNNRLNSEVEFFEGDLQDENIINLMRNYNVWLSNPPYINPENEILDPKTIHEPHMALYGPHEDFLYYYKRLSHLASMVVVRPLILVLELNEFYTQQIVNIYKNVDDIKLIKDLHSKDRMLYVRYD